MVDGLKLMKYDKKAKKITMRFASKSQANIEWTVEAKDDATEISCNCLAAFKQIKCWHIKTAKALLESAWAICDNIDDVEKVIAERIAQ